MSAPKKNDTNVLKNNKLDDSYLSLFKEFPTLVWRAGPDGRCDFFNQTWLNFTGQTLEQELRDGWRSGIHPADRERCLAIYQTAFKAHKPIHMEYRLKRADGAFRWITDFGGPIYDQTGQFTGYIGSGLDVTERKKAEAELHDTKDWLERVYQVTPSAVFTIDNQHHITSFNEKAVLVTGYSPEEVIGQSCRVFALEPCIQSCGLFNEKMPKPIQGRECKIRRKDGEIRIILKNADLLRSDNGEVIGGVESFDDITALKAAEVELKRAKEEAESASEARSRFLANMSHEFRTPMNGIIGMAGLALQSDLNPEQRECLNLVMDSARGLLRMINDILNYSQIESGKLEINSVCFDLRNLIGRIMENHAELAKNKGLKFVSEIGPDVPTYVRGDFEKIELIVSNLVENALRFTEQGMVRLFVVTMGTDQTNASFRGLRFTVSDSGIGIPAAKQDLLFKSFSQVDGSSTRKYGGIGLGLALAGKLVELLQGTISVVSQEGQGSCFTVEIPIEREAAFSSTAVTGLQEKPWPVAASQTTAHPAHILLVEDSLLNQKLMATILERRNYTVTCANDGYQAIVTLQNGGYDLVLMDIQLPKLDGYQTTRAIRAAEAGGGHHIPIIALTANTMPEDDRKCRDAGMNDYLAKPIEAVKLLAAVERQLTPQEDKAPADLSLLLKNLDHEFVIIQELFDAFCNDYPLLMREMEQALAILDFAKISRVAHQLKGTAANFGAEASCKMAAKIEQLAREGNPAAIRVLQGQLSEEMEKVRVYLQNFLAKSSGQA